MDLVSTVVGGIIGFVASLGTWWVTRRKERKDQRKVALKWLQVEVEHIMDRLSLYAGMNQEDRLAIYWPPFSRVAYEALLHRDSEFAPRDKDLLKQASAFYERLHMIEFLMHRFNERDPGGKDESWRNLKAAIEKAIQDGQKLLEGLQDAGV